MPISTIDILNQARGTDSDYAIYKKLKLSAPAVVSTWRKRGHVSAFYTAKLAEMAGINAAKAYILAEAEAETDEEKREYLMKLAEKISANFEALLLHVSPRHH